MRKSAHSFISTQSQINRFYLHQWGNWHTNFKAARNSISAKCTSNQKSMIPLYLVSSVHLLDRSWISWGYTFRENKFFSGHQCSWILTTSVTRLGNLLDFEQVLKPMATINLPKSLKFLGNFCKGVKIYHFSSEIIFGQLLLTFGDFFWSHCSPHPTA